MGLIYDLLWKLSPPGIKWLLRDEFSDTRAAGSVHGTPATPGPGTRVVVDTDGDALSISGGLLRFANPNSIIGNPGLWYGAVARTAGRVLIGRMTPATTGIWLFGWGQDQVDWPDMNSLRFNNTEWYSVQGGVTQASLFVFANTQYSIALILRSAGAYHFAKGGSLANWTLLYLNATNNTTPLYPGVSDYTDTAPTIDSIRIPDVLWLPTPAGFDSFSRANGALGSSETVGPDGQVVTARTYVTQAGVWAVNANTCIATTLGIVTLPALHPDVVIQATLTTPGAGVTPAGIVVRWLDVNNYWYVRVTPGTAGNDFELVEINAGVPTVRGAADKDPAAATAYTITVITYEQTIDVFWNNAREIHYTTAALNETQGIHGLRDEGNTNFIFDDLTIFPRGTGGEYSQLNRWSR